MYRVKIDYPIWINTISTDGIIATLYYCLMIRLISAHIIISWVSTRYLTTFVWVLIGLIWYFEKKIDWTRFVPLSMQKEDFEGIPDYKIDL